MSWILKGLGGPLKGKKFSVRSGLTLGRQGEVVIPDAKASSIHARISQDAGGTWYLEDNSSKNGTRINGERIASRELVHGLIFAIGDQRFEVQELAEKGKEPRSVHDEDTVAMPIPLNLKKSAPAPEPITQPESVADPEPTRVEAPASARRRRFRPRPAPPPQQEISALEPEAAPQPPPPPPPPEPIKRYWNEILAEFLEQNFELFTERKRPVSVLNPAIVLEFVRGLQVNSRWVLGYGPRKIGPRSLDLPIFEPNVPDVCFEILPSSDGIVFKTAHPELVTINGEHLDSHILCVGDTIRINETMIEVDFSNESYP